MYVWEHLYRVILNTPIQSKVIARTKIHMYINTLKMYQAIRLIAVNICCANLFYFFPLTR